MASKISKDHERIAEQLHSVSIHLLRKLRREDDSSGLSAPRLSALSVIVFGGPVTLGDLAAAEQVRPPTMTRIVNALEEQGLVTREKSSGDARRTYLSATPAGRSLLLAGRERRVRALAKRITELSAERVATLRDAAEILRGVVNEI
jgi:DNA-binding MarR family transcriptional regulator